MSLLSITSHSVEQIVDRFPAKARAQVWAIGRAAAWLAVFIALLALVQFSTPGIADNDGYYHIKMGQLIRQQGLTPAFPWLPLSILNQEAFYDHHMLYHVYLALFAGGDTPQALALGAKVASVLMPALAFMAIGGLLKNHGVRCPMLWALSLLAVSEAFLYRMSMPRAQSASLLVLALGLNWLLQKRYRLLLPLGFVYVWLYNAFPLLLLVAGIYVAALFLTERRIAWQALAYPAAGISLGLLINPYFPENLTFIFNHLAPKIAVSGTPVGNEWYPYQTWTLVENSGFALGLWLLGALGLGWRGQRMDGRTLTMFLLSAVFGFLLFKSRRFVEYFPAFAVMFAAFSLAPLLDQWFSASALRQRLAPVVLAAALAFPLTLTLRQARDTMQDAKPADLYAGASHWLLENSSPGSLVFQTDWDDFTRLFFYNTQNLYTIGLDPTYLELYEAELYAEWVQITQGDVEQPGLLIQTRFGAEYVLTDLSHKAFLRQAAEDPKLVEVYRDTYAVVFAIEP